MRYESRETEMAVIGAALQDKEAYERVVLLPEDTFTIPACRVMHNGLKAMWVDGAKEADIVLLDQKVPEGFNMALAVEATMECPSPTLGISYIQVLEEYRQRRVLRSAGESLAKAAGDEGKSLDEITAEFSGLVNGVVGETGSMKMFDALVKWVDQKGMPRKLIQTGVADLDRIIGGIQGGKLIIVGARPAVGKSAFALNIAMHVARHTGPVLFVSLEMDEIEIMGRAVANETGLDSFTLENKELTTEEWEKVGGSLSLLGPVQLHLNTKCDTPYAIRREAMAVRKKHGLCMVVVDYLQLLRSENKKKSRYEEVSDISRELKKLAMELGVPVIALCQLNRESEAKGKIANAPPSMAEARDSGSIEQDANLFVSLWKPSEPSPDKPLYQTYKAIERNGWSPIGMIVNKNRSGRTGMALLGFDKPRMRFYCMRMDEE